MSFLYLDLTDPFMNYKKTFEDERYRYELTISESSYLSKKKLLYAAQNGLWCKWQIQDKKSLRNRELPVTDNDCYIILFSSLIDAVAGAKDFLSL
jgi:hypothetical protein